MAGESGSGLDTGTTGPIRIAFCLDSLDIGGTELNAIRVLVALDRARFAPRLYHFQPEGPLLARFRDAQIPTERISIRSLAHPSVLGASVHLTLSLRRNRIQIFHAQDVYSDIVGIPCARMAGVPVVFASRRWQGSTPRAFHRIAARLSMWLADRVIVNSGSLARTVAAEDGIASGRVEVIPNFVDDSAFRALPAGEIAAWRRLLGLPADRVIVGMVARLVPVKNHAMLLRAFGRIASEAPAADLALIGEGPLRAAVAQQALREGIAGRVHFLGMQRDDRNLSNLFDVAALTSRHEGFPNALVEAMAAGRPIVATAVPGIVDAVQEGRNGLLVPDDDAAALATVLQRLLADATLRAELGLAGRQQARAEYHRDVVIGALTRLYESRLAARLRSG